MAASMRHQEINLVCRMCKRGVEYKRYHQCPHCRHVLDWGVIEMVYDDKYLEIYEVKV